MEKNKRRTNQNLAFGERFVGGFVELEKERREKGGEKGKEG